MNAVALPIAVLQLWQEGRLNIDEVVAPLLANDESTSAARCAHLSPARLLTLTVDAPSSPPAGETTRRGEPSVRSRTPTAAEARAVLVRAVESAVGTDFDTYVEKRILRLPRGATPTERMHVLLRGLVTPLQDHAGDGPMQKGGGEGILSARVLERLHGMMERLPDNAAAADSTLGRVGGGLGFHASALWPSGPRVLWQHFGGGAADGASSLLFVHPGSRLAYWLVTSRDGIPGSSLYNPWESRGGRPQRFAANAAHATPMSEAPDPFSADIVEFFASHFMPHLAGVGGTSLRVEQCDAPVLPLASADAPAESMPTLVAPRCSEWLQPLPPHRHDPVVELLVFPCAGASAPGAYEAWSTRLPSFIQCRAVLLPLRGARAGESMPCQTLDGLARHVAAAARSVLSANPMRSAYALYGHGFGALLAYEFALQARDLVGFPPIALFVSGAECPGWRAGESAMSSSRAPSRGGTSLADEAAQLVDLPKSDVELRTTTLASRRVPTHLRANPLMLRAMASTLQSDLLMEERYLDAAVYPPRKAPSPVFAFAGVDDAEVPDGALMLWESAGESGSSACRVDGGHHFVDDARPRDQLIASVVRQISELLAPSRGGWVDRVCGLEQRASSSCSV